MKRLLTILFILAVLTFTSFGQTWNTGQTKPTTATPLQALNNVTWYMNKPDTLLGANISGMGYYSVLNANYLKRFRLFSDTTRLKGTFSNFKALGKQNKLTITNIGVSGPALLSGDTLNIPQYSGSMADSLKEDKANKENTTISNDTIKYPTVNLLKTYADTKAPASGSANYVQVSPISPQNGNIWISGRGEFGNELIINSQTSGNASLYQFINGNNTNGGYAAIQGFYHAISFDTPLVFQPLGGNAAIGYSSGTQISNYKFSINGSIYGNTTLTIGGLASTNPELLSHSSDGTITKITDGIDGQFLKTNGVGGYTFSTLPKDTLFTIIAISDETTALTVGLAKRTFRMFNCTLVKVMASVTTAPTGSTLIFDINENGTSLLSTKLSIDATEKSSKTATSQAVISNSIIYDDAEITIDIDQVGSTVAGSGAKIKLCYLRN